MLPPRATYLDLPWRAGEIRLLTRGGAIETGVPANRTARRAMSLTKLGRAGNKAPLRGRFSRPIAGRRGILTVTPRSFDIVWREANEPPMIPFSTDGFGRAKG